MNRADVPRANPAGSSRARRIYLRLGRSMTQTPAHAPSTDSRQVSMTSTWIDIEMEGSAFYKSQEQEERYNPFKGLTN